MSNGGKMGIRPKSCHLFGRSLASILLSLLAYHYRRKWISKVLIPVYRMRKNDWDTFEKMYHQLLKQLHLYGLCERTRANIDRLCQTD